MTDTATQAAQALMTARSSGHPMTGFPDGTAPTSVAEAFAIQDAQLVAYGEPVEAWKVGPASDTFPPTCAPIIASRVWKSPVTLEGNLRLRAVEAEVAFRLAEDLPADGGPYTPEQVRAAIATAMVAIEAVETRHAGWPVADPFHALADNQSNEALIIGPEVPLPDAATLGALSGTLELGSTSKPADRGFPGGDPFRLIAWLAGHLAERGPVLSKRGLKAGDIITTGSWNGVDFAEAGMTVRATFPGLGTAELRYG